MITPPAKNRTDVTRMDDRRPNLFRFNRYNTNGLNAIYLSHASPAMTEPIVAPSITRLTTVSFSLVLKCKSATISSIATTITQRSYPNRNPDSALNAQMIARIVANCIITEDFEVLVANQTRNGARLGIGLHIERLKRIFLVQLSGRGNPWFISM